MGATQVQQFVPTFRKSFRVEHVSGEGAFFFGETGHLALQPGATEAVAGLIDGKRSADEIASLLATRMRPEDVHYALATMERSHLIYDASMDGDSELRLWNCLGADLPRVKDNLQRTSVCVYATPDLKAQPLIEALQFLSIKVADDADFRVVLASDYLHPDVAALNDEAIKNGRAWMLVKPQGPMYWFGPIFRPGVTACADCLGHRLLSGRALRNYFDSSRKGTALARSEWPSDLDLPRAAHLAALHVARFVALGENLQLDGKIVTLDPFTLVTTTHIVTRRPQCPKCGEPLAPQPVAGPRLQNRATLDSVDNGHRASSANSTFTRYQHHVSAISGLVTELAPMRTASDHLIKLWLAGHNFAMDTNSLRLIQSTMENRSCGKGITDEQARTGALLEALERYSGVFQGDEFRVKSSYRALGNSAIHPNACMLYSDRQYGRRDDWNRLESPFSAVPNRFDELTEIDWTPVWSLGERDFRYLPTSFLYYGYPCSDPAAAECWADSNGNAAGNTLEEAILHGFLEVVERDAVSIWWYNRLSRPGLDLNSFPDPYIGRCLETYSQIKRQLWVLDLTNDFGIPVFAALSRRCDVTPEEITLGFGAHFDPRVALVRAISEMNQFLPAVSGPIAADGTRQYAYADQAAINWWKSASVASQPYLLPDGHASPRLAQEYGGYENYDQLVDVMHCVLTAQRLGMDTLVLDQTRPDVGVHVAKVILPGARHFWARLAPGRLYDVPVKMGWLSRRRHEEELNPIAMFL
jgi:ribosomal protein S12 methylthiotransferase accessory factor